MIIFTRLTSNNNNWEYPSGHKWSKKDQGNPNYLFENQYGYGNEEWLFNPRYRINEYQYGYIEGIKRSQKKKIAIQRSTFIYCQKGR